MLRGTDSANGQKSKYNLQLTLCMQGSWVTMLLLFLLKKLYFLVQLIHKVALLSDVQQSESLCINTFPLLFRFFSHLGHYRILSRVPCVHSRSLLVICFMYSRVYVSILKLKVKSLSRVRVFVTPGTIAHQSPVHGILQARTLEWVAISFPRGPPWPRDRTRVSHTARQS